MFKLDFQINKLYLYSKVVQQFKLLGKEGENLEKRLWKKSEFTYSLISGVRCDRHIADIIIKNAKIDSWSEELVERTKLAKKILKQELESKEFLKIIRETEEYKEKVTKQWAKKQKQVMNYLQDITGLKLPNKIITVYLVHPKLHDGRYWNEGGKDIITWGHPEDWENYTIVYLAHELMHFLTKKYKGDKKFLHALIELTCDNELRLRLNQTGEYFREGDFDIGHKDLRSIEEKILPQWRKYLKERKEKNLNIFDFIDFF